MPQMETGTVVLKNTKEYSFYDSGCLVMLTKERENTDYFVRTTLMDNAGDAHAAYPCFHVRTRRCVLKNV